MGPYHHGQPGFKVSALLSHCCSKIFDNSGTREEDFILAWCLRGSVAAGRHGSRSTEWLVTQRPQRATTTDIHLFNLGLQLMEWCYPHHRVGLHTWVKPLWTHPNKRVQCCFLSDYKATQVYNEEEPLQWLNGWAFSSVKRCKAHAFGVSGQSTILCVRRSWIP